MKTSLSKRHANGPVDIGDLLNRADRDAPIEVDEDDLGQLLRNVQASMRVVREEKAARKAAEPPRSVRQGAPPVSAPTPRRAPVVIDGRSGDQMPFWPDAKRGIPSEMVRSALFTIGQSGKRRHYHRERLTSISTVEVRYTGHELRQRDEDVFLQILHMASRSRTPGEVVFTASELIEHLGWTRNGRSYDELADTITRLKEASITIKGPLDHEIEITKSSSLIRDFTRAKRTRDYSSAWCVSVDPTVINLFVQKRYTLIDWSQRLKLSPLAKWLHSFYHSHREPYAMFVATLHGLCGSQMATVKRFRQQIRAALDELVDVGFLSSWTIDPSSKVHVTRKADTPESLPA